MYYGGQHTPILMWWLQSLWVHAIRNDLLVIRCVEGLNCRQELQHGFININGLSDVLKGWNVGRSYNVGLSVLMVCLRIWAIDIFYWNMYILKTCFVWLYKIKSTSSPSHLVDYFHPCFQKDYKTSISLFAVEPYDSWVSYDKLL